MNDSFWNKFYNRPPNEIPWQNTQADWFKELVDIKVVNGKTALDLGCGTGMKSIYLAQYGFEEIIGIDIAPKAIEIAKQNAVKKEVSDICKFVTGDITNWNFIEKDKKFDLILDWAAIHCLPPDEMSSYAQKITNHSHKETLLLIRAFSSESEEGFFVENNEEVETNVYFLSISKIKKLFPEFEILKHNKSLPRTKKGYFFIEVLMKKI